MLKCLPGKVNVSKRKKGRGVLWWIFGYFQIATRKQNTKSTNSLGRSPESHLPSSRINLHRFNFLFWTIHRVPGRTNLRRQRSPSVPKVHVSDQHSFQVSGLNVCHKCSWKKFHLCSILRNASYCREVLAWFSRFKHTAVHGHNSLKRIWSAGNQRHKKTDT